MHEQIYQFDEFSLDVANRRLRRGDETLNLSAKAFDLLKFLVENRGRLVSKDELFEGVWGDQIVEESNLTVHVSQIRKALGESMRNPRFIETVSGYGYRFIAEVDHVDSDEIVIETEAFSQIVIEETTVLPAGNDEIRQLPAAARGAWWRSKRVVGIAGAVVLIIALFIVYKNLSGAGPSPRIQSIAVLPFKPLVVQARDESLEMGMADTLITKLSAFRDVEIRPINSVRKYSAIEQDAVIAGREQRVDAVLEGQIQRADEKIRVTVRLVTVADGKAVWADRFDESWSDIFKVQDSIAQRVADALSLRLSSEAASSGGKESPVNPEAYRLYLLGRYHLNRLTDEDFNKGKDYFLQAIEKEPQFAAAYAGLADAYSRLSGWNAVPPHEGFPKARDAAIKALQYDERSAEAHTILGVVKHFYDWDWNGAEAEFKRAIEINPNSADARQMYSYNLSARGRFDEALEQMKRANELEPLSIEKAAGIGEVLYFERRFDEAIAQYRKVLEMDPNSGFLHWAIGNALAQKRMYPEAVNEFEKSIPLSSGSPDEPAMLAYTLALSGRRAEAVKLLDELKERSKTTYVSPTIIAFIHTGLGENDEAFAWLDKAHEGRDSLLVLLRVMPIFDPLRNDPRFGDLERRVGFRN